MQRLTDLVILNNTVKFQEKIKLAVILAVTAGAAAIIMTVPTQLGLDLRGGSQLVLQAQDSPDHKVDGDSILGAMAVIRSRVDGLGISEPVISQKGMSQIIVELPGIKDPDQAVKMIGETAQLSFVEAEWAPMNAQDLTPEQLEQLAGAGATVAQVRQLDREGNVQSERPIFLKRVVLTGASLKEVSPGNDQYGNAIVSIAFDSEGTQAFAQVTRENIGKPLAILLDNVVISAPNVRVAILDGRAQISGMSIREMRNLVIQLKAGSLPVPVEIVSNKVVGPTLGRDSIYKSKIAGLMGFSLVCLLMVSFYRIPGIIACCGLVIFFLLSLASLKLLQATLTLPGIAGLLLSLGMAVDANVIIFERVKEEFRARNPLLTAVNIGFTRAFSAILDSNVTTLMASFVLFFLGSGSIKGFAVTLSLGIVVSMFSAIFATRSFLALVMQLPIPESWYFSAGKKKKEK